MSWIRDPRPGIAWRTKRLRNRAKRRIKRERRRLPESIGRLTYRDKGLRFRSKWGAAWYDRPIKEHLVLYESFGGNGALCSPRAVFDELLHLPDMRHLRHVWCFNNIAVKRDFDAQFATHPRVRSVLTGSLSYYRLLSTAKYLVNNQTFPPNFVKRQDQVYLNTWHGCPLKTMGYHSPEGPYAIRNTVRNFLAADYLLSTSQYMTEELYARGYRLRGIYGGTVIEEGYPRVDTHFSNDSDDTPIHTELRSNGLEITGEKLVLYAPTWRGTSFFNPTVDVDNIHAEIETIAELLDPDFTILLKVHQQIYRRVSQHHGLAHRLVPNTIPVNRVLTGINILITDYSSIFFDFLTTGRPILFYLPDMQTYERDRGLLLDLSDLPGPTYNHPADLATGISALGSGSSKDPLHTHRERYRAAITKYCPRDDGQATSRVIDIVFRGNTHGYNLYNRLPDDRTSVLIWAGNVRTSGVITSLLSLLKNIDSERYDVTLLMHPARNNVEKELQSRVPSSIRHLIRTGTFPITARRFELFNQLMSTGLDPDAEFPAEVEQLLNAEWRHCLGLSDFDHLIEFSGYTPFWASVMLCGGGTRSIWLHNDLWADSQRGQDDPRFRHTGLAPTFTLYQYFDNLVSVSRDLAQLNADSLSHFAPSDKYRYAHNTIDVDRIRAMLGDSSTIRGAVDAPNLTLANNTLATAAKRLVDSYPPELVSAEVDRQAHLAKLMPDRDTTTTFITVGRLSPEKNHARMIRAFSQVHNEDPNTRLLILGDGPLLPELETLANRMLPNDVVRFAGHQSNPYVLMAEADCFVLSSDYEGQPMVLLEALTLGLPVVTVEFGSAGSAVPDGSGHIVRQTDNDLAAGMRSFLAGEIVRSAFDPAQYNRLAVQEFEHAISGKAPPTDL